MMREVTNWLATMDGAIWREVNNPDVRMWKNMFGSVILIIDNVGMRILPDGIAVYELLEGRMFHISGWEEIRSPLSGREYPSERSCAVSYHRD